jgi:hypothetical protein
LGAKEQHNWVLTQIQNQRGVRIDSELRSKCLTIAAARLSSIQDEVRQATGGALYSVQQVQAMREWLAANGCTIADVQAPTIEKALKHDDLSPAVRHVLNLRAEAAHNLKAEGPQACCDLDNRLRDTTIFWGAGTGRHASRSPNLQNLQREDGDTLAKVKAVLSGDLVEVAKFGPALQVLGSIERALICAELGKRFCLADWSGQESRGLAYIAGEQWKCDAWDKADHSNKPEDQPYYLLGIKCGMRPDIARAFGKALDFACGYGSGPARVRQQILKSFPELADADFERFVNIWRAEHPITCRFWKYLQRVAVNGIHRPNIELKCGKLALWFDGTFLKIQLPSQRCISYPFARTGPGKYNDEVVLFKDAQRGRFEDCNHGHGFWGGALVENVVQGIGRDILMDAVERLENAHYDVVLTIHDEVICEVAEDFGSLEEFTALVAQRPIWAPDLPLSVKARIGPRLANIDLPVTASVPGSLDTVPRYTAQHKVKAPKAKTTKSPASGKSSRPSTRPRSAEEERRAALAAIIDRHVAEGRSPSLLAAIAELDAMAPAASATGTLAASEAADMVAMVGMVMAPSLAPGEPLGRSGSEAPDEDETPTATVLSFPAKDASQARHNSATGSPHGVAGPPRGERKATWIYDSLDQEFYLLVEKRIAANGERNFYQYHWNGTRWDPQIIGTYAERKVPYQFRALKAALVTDPNILVNVTEGEKDADTLRRLGFVATTNPGGANQWTDDLTAWLRVLGVHRVVIHEDNDKAGKTRTATLAVALSGFATVRVAQYLDVPEGEDVTYWIEEQGHTKADLEARVATAKAVNGTIDFSDVALTAQDWLARDLAEPDLLMGHVLSTTVQALLNATTGIGKTNFSMALFGHIGAGKDFLHWHCPRPRHVLYIDGEMSRKLFRDRIGDVVRRLGSPPVGTYFFNKADVEGFAPLNTAEGQAAIWQLIAEIERRSGQQLDAVCFDSIMALLLGDMKEEDAWRDTMPLVYALTKRQIGQLWVHHTGHDTSRGYGTKTREWQLDTVMHLDVVARPDTDVSFALTFPKARERTPDNRADFVNVDIALVNDQWTGAATTNVKAKISEGLVLKFFEALQRATDNSSIAATGGRPTATLEEWRAQCVTQGLLEGKSNVRATFSKYKLKLIAANWIACDAERAWILP